MRHCAPLSSRSFTVPISLHDFGIRCFTAGTSRSCRRLGRSTGSGGMRLLITSLAKAEVTSIFSYCDHECSAEAWRRPLHTGPTTIETAPIVALGKFDALHKGHRALAAAASTLGAPWLVSFAGIAEVLGWAPRLPLVAACDRRRVLTSWADVCDGVAPSECAIPFADIRHLSPEAFIELLARDLKVSGVVVGANYRFGYKAAGTTELLLELAPKYGLQVKIIDLVGGQEGVDEGTLVSSSWIRKALSAGDVAGIAACLDRPYRMVIQVDHRDISKDGRGWRVSPIAYHNQPPHRGTYQVQVHSVEESGSLVEAKRLTEVVTTECVIDVEGMSVHGGVVPDIEEGRVVIDFIC